MTSSTARPAAVGRPHPDLSALARAVARLLDDAVDAGLALPSSVNIHDYGPASVSLHIYGRTPEIMRILAGWGSRYHGDVCSRAAYSDPTKTHASVEFTHRGVTYEVSTIIRTDDVSALIHGQEEKEDQP